MDKSPLSVRHYLESDTSKWDELVNRSMNGTFLHSRRYLSYHADRFEDRSVLVEDGSGRLVGVLPAAVDPADAKTVISHPGLTYGGLVHAGRIAGQTTIAALGEITGLLAAEGFERFLYKAVPYIYQRVPAGDDLYALHRLGARHYRCDLSSTIDLENRGPVEHGRHYRQGRAERAGVTIGERWEDIGPFWDVLGENLRRHGVSPTHSLSEVERLHELFPEEIRLLCGTAGDEVFTGALLFLTPLVVHAQYIASSEKGRKISAADAVIGAAIDRASAAGHRYFDFGISTEDEGRVLNQSLYEFKTSFGAGGVVHDHFELLL